MTTFKNNGFSCGPDISYSIFFVFQFFFSKTRNVWTGHITSSSSSLSFASFSCPKFLDYCPHMYIRSIRDSKTKIVHIWLASTWCNDHFQKQRISLRSGYFVLCIFRFSVCSPEMRIVWTGQITYSSSSSSFASFSCPKFLDYCPAGLIHLSLPLGWVAEGRLRGLILQGSARLVFSHEFVRRFTTGEEKLFFHPVGDNLTLTCFACFLLPST